MGARLLIKAIIMVLAAPIAVPVFIVKKIMAGQPSNRKAEGQAKAILTISTMLVVGLFVIAALA